jgi:hypothetical protein
MNSSQAETEARAKIIWGESPESVMVFLRSEGHSPYEAQELVESFLQERQDSLRQEGFKKLAWGASLFIAALVAGFVVLEILPNNHIETSGKIVGMIFLLGAYGAWKLIDGAMLILSPGSTRGDLANRDEL